MRRLTEFIKLRDGSWGVIGRASRVKAGRGVFVTRRDGSRTKVRVQRVIFTNTSTHDAIAVVDWGSTC